MSLTEQLLAGAIAAMAGLGTALAGWLFNQRARRQKSEGDVAAAEDAIAIRHLDQRDKDYAEQREELKKFADLYGKAQLTIERMNSQATIREMEIKLMQRHVVKLTERVVHDSPDDALELQESGFMDMQGLKEQG